MFSYLNFKPTKNQAFRLYFSLDSSAGGNAPDSNAASLKRDFISKDGAEYDLCTNSRVQIAPDASQGDYETRGSYYIDLTADEMNADVIVYKPYANITVEQTPIVIYTTTEVALTPEVISDEVWSADTRELTGSPDPGVSNFSANFLNFLIDAIQNSFDLADFMLAEDDYNYYGIRHTNQDWIIVKESIIDSTLTYAYNENNNGKKYDAAWTNHSALTFAASQTKI